MKSDFADVLVLTVALVGIAFGAGEWVGRTSVEPTVRTVQVCSPRSVDAYSPRELRSIALMRERMGVVK